MTVQAQRSKFAANHKNIHPAVQFEMGIRADKLLNITARLVWLVASLSRTVGCFMDVDEMARQLNASTRQLREALCRVMSLGLFECVEKEIEGRTCIVLQRILKSGQSNREFDEMVLNDERLCPTVRLHWLLSNLTSHIDDITNNEPYELLHKWEKSIDKFTLRRSRQRINELGYFNVKTSIGRKAVATYTRNGANWLCMDGVVDLQSKRDAKEDVIKESKANTKTEKPTAKTEKEGSESAEKGSVDTEEKVANRRRANLYINRSINYPSQTYGSTGRLRSNFSSFSPDEKPLKDPDGVYVEDVEDVEEEEKWYMRY